MTAHRRAGLAAVLLTAAALALAAPAVAQTDDTQPLVLIPLDDTGTTGDGAATGTGATTQPSISSTDGLEIESLAAVSSGSAGTLDIEAGGLGMTMWQGSDPRLVAALLAALPAGNGSAAATDLARRLLLSIAEPPEAVEADLLGLRVERLVALGLGAEVPALAASAGRGALSGLALRGIADAYFLAGDTETACRAVRDGVALSDDAGLQKALIFCQRLAGEGAAADLGLAVLQDSGGELEPQFLALDQAIAAGRRGEIDSLEGAGPLIFAMALAADVAIDATLAAGAPPAVQRAIADYGLLDADTRLVAGELATARGAMPGAAMARLYESIPFEPGEISSALSKAGAMPGPSGRALLFLAGLQQSLAAGRAEALASLLHHAAETAGAPAYLAAARASAEQLAAIQPASELAWFSADASAALLLAGEPEMAARWWPLLQDRAQGNVDFAVRATALWPMFRVAFGEQLPDSGQGMADWWLALAQTPETRRLALAETYLAAFAAFDDPAGGPLLPELVAAPPLDETPAAPAALLVALDQASRAGRIGETVALALVALGPQGPAGADAMALNRAVAALRAVGLGREARLIALEAGGQREIAAP